MKLEITKQKQRPKPVKPFIILYYQIRNKLSLSCLNGVFCFVFGKGGRKEELGSFEVYQHHHSS